MAEALRDIAARVDGGAVAAYIPELARADHAHVVVVGRDRPAATLELGTVLRVEIGLLDLDLCPVDVELVGDDLRQRSPDALARLGVLRDDGEGVVGMDRDVGVRRERFGRGARPAC